MKRTIKLIILIAMSLSVYFIYNKKEGEKINYVSIGDGFSLGLNSYQEPSYGYNDYLKDYLKNNNLLNSYNKFSYEEMMTTDLKKDILINIHQNSGKSIKEVLREADLLTISVGINDFIYKINTNYIYNSKKMDKVLTKIVDNLNSSMKEIRKYYKKDIYIVGYYNFYPQNSVERTKLNQLNRKIKSYCKKHNIIFVDNSNLNNNLTNYLENPNSIYPNINGYKEIFNNIINTSKI